MKSKYVKEPMTDCFAYKDKYTCDALTEMVCTYKNCSFYKNRRDVDLEDIRRRG